jgi:acyl-CoA synthetase (AMP-forming)/AMP-acid ligase II
VILGAVTTDTSPAPVPRTVLDDLFRRTAARRPEALALIDPPNRESFTDGPPRRITYAEADRMITAIALRLRSLGLQTDAVVGMQLPNTVESVLALLGVLRAGMIAAPMPLLWRQAESAPTLRRLGARAIITASRLGDFDLSALATRIAAEIFSIRHIMAFGRNVADGVQPFDDVLDETPVKPPVIERAGDAAAHVAVVTMDVTPRGAMAVARNHAELLAGGSAVSLEAGLRQESHLLGAFALSSFAGLAGIVVPWLLTGGTLSLHHGFDADAFAAQCRSDQPNAVALPGMLASQINDADLLAHRGLETVQALWRTPERLRTSAPWQHPRAALTDVVVFGEIGLIAGRRDPHGEPQPLPAGAVATPRRSDKPINLIETGSSTIGALTLRGPMVPRHAFPRGAEHLGKAHLKAGADGFVDTGYVARIDKTAGTVAITAPPPGMVGVGGYRFVLGELEQLVWRANGAAFITALPDALAGHRLAGISGTSADMQTALHEIGVNPLLAEAFSESGKVA